MNHFRELSDEQLTELSADSDQAFYVLLKRYEKKILAYISRSTSVSPEHAEDILQETFLKVYKNMNGFDSSLKFSSWIYRIAHNEIVNFYRKNKKETLTVSMEANLYATEMPAYINDVIDIRDVILTDEKNIQIKESLLTLSPKYRDIIVLRYLEEKDYTEISDILKIPLGTVATRINRAKNKLKKIIIKNHKWLINNE